MGSEPLTPSGFRKHWHGFIKLWREDFIAAFVYTAIISIPLGWPLLNLYFENSHLKSENVSLAKSANDLDSENKRLKDAIDRKESEIEGLHKAIDPLIDRATKEFPGEEINSSLKKIIQKLEAVDPWEQPIAAAKATIEIRVVSQDKLNNHFMDRGGYAAIGKGNDAMLVARGTESSGIQQGNGEVLYTAEFNSPASDPGIGKQLKVLSFVDYFQIVLDVIPKNANIIGGKIIWALNNSITLTFDIPMQISDDQQRIFVREVKNAFPTTSAK